MLRTTAALTLLLSGTAYGQFNFAEEFNTTLTNSWGLTPPFPHLDISGTSFFDGLPSYNSMTVDGAQTFRFTNTLAPQHVVGMIAAPTLVGSRGSLTARINTLTQDFTHIDGMFLMMLVDAQDNTRWVETFLFGTDYSTGRLWGGQASFGPLSYFTQGYTNNTWYRPQVVVNGSAVEMNLWADDGVTLLGRYDFTAPAGYFSGQWKVALGQYMGTPNGNGYMTDVAVDWIHGEALACGQADVGSAGGLPQPDGTLDNNDFIAFINYFFASDAHADVGRTGGMLGADGAFDNNDFIAFITLFFEGC